MAATRNYELISADSHVVEPPDLWDKWLDAKLDHSATLGIPEDLDGSISRAQLLTNESGGGRIIHGWIDIPCAHSVFNSVHLYNALIEVHNMRSVEVSPGISGCHPSWHFPFLTSQ